MIDAPSFGDALREHRLARWLTQAALAEMAGLSDRAISDLERGLKRPQRATVRMLIDALSLPPDQAEAFELAARVRLPPLSPRPDQLPSIAHNLPVQLTSFVGREQEVNELEQFLSRSRLVTLVGPPGGGKTRLALQAANSLVGKHGDGVWLV